MRAPHILTLAVVLSLAAGAVPAKGQDRPGAGRRHCHTLLQVNDEKLKVNFQSLDANHNGVLTQEDSVLKHANRMCVSRLDRNHDHRLSADEPAVG